MRITGKTWVAGASLLATALMFGGHAMAGGSIKDQPEEPKRGVWFGGTDFANGATYSFDGIIVAFNRDISKSGWALRAYGSYLEFDQDPTGDGRAWQGDLMLGYLFNRSNLYGGIFVGVDYQNYKLKPDDPTAGVRGTEWGAKIAADLATGRDGPHYFAIAGSYSTAFDSYWSRVRGGFNRGRYTFGVEGSAFGNEDFDAQRLGGFVMFDLNILPKMPIEVTFSAGHQFVNDSGTGGTISTGGGEGAYATIVFSSAF